MRSIVVGVFVVAPWLAAPARADGDDSKPADQAELEASAEALSLADVFKVAVRTAPELENAAFTAGDQAALAEAAEGPEDLAIIAEGNLDRVKGGPSRFLGNVARTDTASASLDVRKLLPTNGTLDLIAALTSSTDFDDSGTKQPNSSFKSTGVSLRLTQPLMRGFGPSRESSQIRAAKHAFNAALIRQAATARAYAATLVEGYWRLALAWRRLAVARSSLELASKQATSIERAVKQGNIARSELLPLEEAEANREQDILAAELDVVSRSIDLRRLAGMEIKPEALPVRTAELPEPDTAELDLAGAVALALDTSDEINAATEDARAAHAALDGSRRDTLPRLDLTVQAGPLGSGATFGDANKQLGKFDGYEVSAGLTFEWEPSNHAASGAYHADRYRAGRADFDALQTRADVAGDVARTVYAIKAQQLATGLAAKAVKLAEASVEAEQKKFELGKSSTTEIVRRQDDLGTARLRQAQTIAEYMISRAQLEAATGEILKTYGITIKDYKKSQSRE